MIPAQLVVACLLGWLQREQSVVIAYLREENRGQLRTAPSDGLLDGARVFLCDRDRKWSLAVWQLRDSGIQVIQTPFRAPNCNAHAERVVRSIKEECLDRLIPLGERYLRHALAEYLVHYHREHNHQGLANELVEGTPDQDRAKKVRCRQRLGGLLSYYHRAA